MISNRARVSSTALRCVIVPIVVTLAGAASAQTSTPAAAGAAIGSDPSPYYIGGSQAFTHDSNAFRIPFGPSDNYSSTSLLAGFDQPFSRQRVFGTASVSLNRYQHLNELNNTSYALLTGLDWATLYKLSGNVSATLDQQLAAPSASVDAPDATRTLLKRKGVSGLARWGGNSQLSVDGRLGYSSQDQSGQSQASNSTNESGSLGAFYQPGTLLKLGVAVRFDRTRAPNALGLDQANDTRGRNIDFLADYNNGNTLTTSGRISYTRQTNTNASNADFSGLTGSINLGYRATAKIAVNLAASRNAGFNAANRVYSPVIVTATPVSASPNGTTATFYENNQVTNAASMGVSYAATAKIGLTGNVHYSRARVVTSSGGVGNSDVGTNATDMSRGAGLGGSYAFSRALTFACSVSRERRVVTDAVSYRYTDDVAACSGQFLWR